MSNTLPAGGNASYPSGNTAARAGGIALILAAILFMAVFSYLAATFDYPDVLDRPAAEVLPRLVALGSSGRAVWAQERIGIRFRCPRA